MTVPEKVRAGVEEALLHYSTRNKEGRTFVVASPSRDKTRALRDRLGMSQSQFAIQFGISIRTLQKWERGETTPEGPARAYLAVIEQIPAAVLQALRKSRDESVVENHGEFRAELT